MNKSPNPKSFFSDYVEKFVDKNHMWTKRWLIVQGSVLSFYDKKPGIMLIIHINRMFGVVQNKTIN
jgi:hypothetical protein